MQGLRHVLHARLALVADQNERQRVLALTTELINAGAAAGLGDGSNTARFLNRDCIACDSILAPDLCLRLHSSDMKCAVGIQRPDGAQGVEESTNITRMPARMIRRKLFMFSMLPQSN